MLTAIDNNAGRRQRCDGDPVAPVYAGRQRRSDMTGGLRASGTELNRRAIDLSAMAHAVAAETSVLDAAREVEWVIASGIKVFADAALMRRLLQVLLGNAFRFSGDGRPARVEVGFRRVEACRIEIFVSDNGVGFDMQDGDRLFNPMRRPSADDPMEGEGARLPAVWRIVEMHDGSTRAESGAGAGATIAFSLPDWSMDALRANSPGSDCGERERAGMAHLSRLPGEAVAAPVEWGGNQGANQTGSRYSAAPNAARVARLCAEVEQFRFPGRPVLILLIALAGVAALLYGR